MYQDEEKYQPTRRSEEIPSSPLSDSSPGLPALGSRLLNRYEIFGIRQGGLGVVYLVTDRQTGQQYAIKTYKPEFKHLAPGIEQFRSEVEFWINLEPHPNIVKAHFVEVVDGQPHLFMEYVDGGTRTSLRDWMRQGPLSREQAAGFAYQLCLAMEFANRTTEIVHGDLKPENILIDSNGVLKVTDFSLAHRVQISQGSYPRLQMGSWPYASPERFKGEVEDARSDMYSFGILFYEMLTGQLPYPFPLLDQAEGMEAQLRHFHLGRGGHELCQEFYYGSRTDPTNEILLKCLDDQAERFINFSGLRKSLEKRFSIDPAQYTSRLGSAGTDLHQRALALHRIGRFSEAMLLYNTLLQRHPYSAVLWFDAAQTLSAAGQHETAEAFLKRARELDSSVDSSL